MERPAWNGQLRALVERHCGARVVALEPISRIFDDRVVCRARFADRPLVTLRAFSGQVQEWLLAQVAALDYLEARSFPAPRVVRGASGQTLASHAGWTALVLTFVEGTDTGFSPAALEAIAEHAAVLHALPTDCAPGLGASRLTPSRELTRLLPRLEQAGGHVQSPPARTSRGARPGPKQPSGLALSRPGRHDGECLLPAAQLEQVGQDRGPSAPAAPADAVLSQALGSGAVDPQYSPLEGD